MISPVLPRIAASVLLVASLFPAVAADELPTILVTRQLAEAQGLTVGDAVNLSTSPSGGRPETFRVVGVYEPNPDPMKLTADRFEARLHLPDLIDMTADPLEPGATERVGAINVKLADPARAAELASTLSGQVPGGIALPTAGGGAGSNPFVALERFHLAIALVTVLASTAFLLALMVLRADERRETVGILRLIGFSRHRVLLEVFLEGLLIALVGACFGIALATSCQGLFNAFFQWHYDTTLVFVRVTPGIVLRCLAISLPLGVMAGVGASLALLRRDILALLRR